MKKTALLAIAVLLLPISAWPDGNNYGSSVYLRQGVGARALGMGGAFVALADDATAGYWNPAGLSQMNLYTYEVGSQYAVLSNQMSSSYLSYAFQWDEIGSFELGWINFNSGEIEKRDVTGLIQGNFVNLENAIILSYGRKTFEWVKGLSLGANLKVLQQGLDGFSAVGHGLDIGALWQPIPYLDHCLGLNIQNIFQRLYWSTTENNVDFTPLNVKLGAAFKFLPSSDRLYFNHLITALDVEVSEYSRFNYRVGAEYWFIQSLGARLGYDGQGITAGASYNSEYYEVDYAFRYDPGELQAHQHRVSLMLRIPGEGGQPLRQVVPAESSTEPEMEAEPILPKPTAVPTQATPVSTHAPTQEPTQAPTPEPTPEQTPEPIQIPTLVSTAPQSIPEEEKKVAESELVGPLNSIYTNPLGLVSFYDFTGIMLELEYERALSENISLAIKGLYTWFGGKSGGFDSSFSLIGPGVATRYYFSPKEGKQAGFWAGPVFSCEFGGYNMYDGQYSHRLDVNRIKYGAEAGYKWHFGPKGWFVVSPYLGMYQITYGYGSNTVDGRAISYPFALSYFVTSIGVNVGIAF